MKLPEGERAKKLEQMQALAVKKGGECLSLAYINANTKLHWKCEKGHQWEATPTSVKNGNHWCPKCSGTQRLSIEDMDETAAARGGRCLSRVYLNAVTKLEWECHLGHRWFAVPQSVYGLGTWCPECNGNTVYSITDMRELAAKRGGVCMSETYRGMNQPLIWRCSEGHQWEAKPNTLFYRNSWCSVCAGNAIGTLPEMQEVASSRSGKCLSRVYINSTSPLEWECALGHRWTANPVDIKAGRWCPLCSSSRRERLCRSIFSALFGVPFKRLRPDWLLNSSGNRMEFDGYNQAVNLAWEHHGEQHYKPSRRFHKGSEKSLQKRMKDDEQKRQICSTRGIRLIEIPYNIPMEEIEAFIRAESEKLGISIPRLEPIEISTTDVWSPSELEAMRELAYQRNGVCLSTEYRGDAEHLRWQCVRGHEWDATPSNIKRGKWCPVCAGVARLSIEEMKRIAKDRGGECLSLRYIDGQHPLRWRCAEGHEWDAPGIRIKHQSWCPHCSGNAKLTLGALQGIAQKRGGKCLANEYINSSTPVMWECEKGHQWRANAASVCSRGSWCPTCAGRPPLGVEDMNRMAQERGGRFLSTNYTNGKTKYLWECKLGHKWEASGTSIRNQGTWCPHCPRKES